MQGRTVAAIAELSAAARRDPRHAGAHGNLGRLRRASNQPGPAEAHLRSAVELQPENAEWHNELGVVLARQGRLEEAQRCFGAAVRREPDNEQFRQNLARAAALRPAGGETRLPK